MTGHTSFPAAALWARTVSTGGDKSCFRDTAMLPEKPDLERANGLLVRIREEMYKGK
jgi:hypothetical protein